MKTRVLFLNRSYWPDTEATGQLLTELCEDLAATGDFDVHVMCGAPNHVSDRAAVDHQRTAVHRGVTIHRVPHTQFSKRSMVGKLTNLVSFTVSAWWNAGRAPRPDVVVTETDPFFLGLLGRRLQRKLRCRFVAYLQDIYPDVAVAVGKAREGWLVRLLRRLLFSAYAAADRVVVLSRDMKVRCIDNGVEASRIEVIPNWADTEALKPVPTGNEFRRKFGLGDRFVVMYSGNMGLPHLLTPILDAAERLKDRPDIVFLFVGDGVQRRELEMAAAARSLENVSFLPYQPKDFLSHSLSAGDVQIVSVKPGVISCLMPSKLYGILAAGSSVLTIAPADCELAEVVRTHDLGENCDLKAGAKLGEEIAAAILRLCDRERLASITDRARRLAVEAYSRTPQVLRFRELLSAISPRKEACPSKGQDGSDLHIDRREAAQVLN